jgi:hypothetical protein
MRNDHQHKTTTVVSDGMETRKKKNNKIDVN